MFCSKCGKELSDDVKFCPDCGQQVGGIVTKNETEQSKIVYVKLKEEPKSVFIALVLCFLLGMIGIHDFYLKRNNAAVAKIAILFLLGWIYIGFIINGIWCIIDFFTILFRGYEALWTEEEKENYRKNAGV